MNRIHSIRWAISLIAVAGLLGGCSWFHQDTHYYDKARETQPLEVPPDLDTPVSSDTLSIPQSGSGSAAQASASQPGSTPPTGVIAGGGSLRIADGVDHAWQRVGLALERAQAGTISARDATAHTYTLEVSGLRAPAPAAAPAEHHWYSRILHPFGGGSNAPADTGPVSGSLTVTVSADGDGARVEVNGPEEAARRVLAILRERLS